MASITSLVDKYEICDRSVILCCFFVYGMMLLKTGRPNDSYIRSVTHAQWQQHGEGFHRVLKTTEIVYILELTFVRAKEEDLYVSLMVTDRYSFREGRRR